MNISLRRQSGCQPTRSDRAVLAAALIFSVLAFDPMRAHATGYFIDQQSVSGLGRADAGDAAAAEDASTVFYNPAGMTELWSNTPSTGNTLLQSGVQVIFPRTRVTNDGSTAETPGTDGLSLPYPGGDGVNPGRISPVPNFYVVHRIYDGAAYVGLGVTAPFGLSGLYNSSWFGRYDDLAADLLTINIGPVIAIPINRYVSIGAGIDIQYQSSVLSSALPDPFVPLGPTTASDGHFDARGTAWALGYNIGILVKPTKDLRLGVQYRSAVDHTIKGTASFSGFTGPLSVLNGSTGAEAVNRLPNILTLGVAYQLSPKTDLFGGISWYGWNRVGAVDIHLDNGMDISSNSAYRNALSVAVGLDYRWSNALTLRTGFKFDQTPTEDAYRNTSFPDANRYWLTVGASYKISPRFAVDFALAHVFEDAVQVNVTRTYFDNTPLASAVNVRANVQSSVTTVSAAINYRF